METKPMFIYKRVGGKDFVDIFGHVVHTGDAPPDGYRFVLVGKFLNSVDDYEIYESRVGK